jgi:hypothetical protein
VDNAQALAAGHVYGDKPCVTVTARCEVVYLRHWDLPLMPAMWRQRLGIPADAQPPDAAPPAAPGAAPAAQQAAATVAPVAAR